MRKDSNKSRIKFIKRQEAWEVEIGIHSKVNGNLIQTFKKAKKLKFRVILS